MSPELEKKVIRAAVEAIERVNPQSVSLKGTELIIEVDTAGMPRWEIGMMLDHIESVINNMPT